FGLLGPFSVSGQLCPLRGQAPGNSHGQTCIRRGAFCRLSTCLTHGKCIEEPFWFHPTSRSKRRQGVPYSLDYNETTSFPWTWQHPNLLGSPKDGQRPPRQQEAVLRIRRPYSLTCHV
ncbi:hypothetical protein H671_8g19547, partial [Cricetulus griseus]